MFPAVAADASVSASASSTCTHQRNKWIASGKVLVRPTYVALRSSYLSRYYATHYFPTKIQGRLLSDKSPMHCAIQQISNNTLLGLGLYHVTIDILGTPIRSQYRTRVAIRLFRSLQFIRLFRHACPSRSFRCSRKRPSLLSLACASGRLSFAVGERYYCVYFLSAISFHVRTYADASFHITIQARSTNTRFTYIRPIFHANPAAPLAVTAPCDRHCGMCPTY